LRLALRSYANLQDERQQRQWIIETCRNFDEKDKNALAFIMAHASSMEGEIIICEEPLRDISLDQRKAFWQYVQESKK